MIDSELWRKGTDSIFAKHGVFFAIGQAAFDEKRQDGVKYTSAFPGVLCPTENVSSFFEEYRGFNSAYAAKELDKYGAEKIILYHLKNIEYQFTPDLERAAHCVAEYGLTTDDVVKYIPAYMKLCDENDWY